MYLIIAAGLIGSVTMLTAFAQRRQRYSAHLTVEWMQHLRQLLELLPKHRGMANALLKGDQSFRQSIEKLQQEVSAHLERMERFCVSYPSVADNNALAPIRDAWTQIRKKLTTLDAEKSFQLHTQLIAMALERMEDDSIYLQRFVGQNHQMRSSLLLLVRELPQVVESIGQARGIGTGVAAQQSSTIANRVNLKYLHEKTASIINDRLVPLQDNAINGHALRNMDVFSASADKAVNFLDILRQELIDSDTPTIKPETFYKKGTEAIDACFELFDTLLPRWTQVAGIAYTRT
jgi:methyl-accepting chemotaxis protein